MTDRFQKSNTLLSPPLQFPHSSNHYSSGCHHVVCPQHKSIQLNAPPPFCSHNLCFPQVW